METFDGDVVRVSSRGARPRTQIGLTYVCTRAPVPPPFVLELFIGALTAEPGCCVGRRSRSVVAMVSEHYPSPYSA